MTPRLGAMNMTNALSTITVDQSLNFKRVTADAQVTMPSNFMSLIGVDTLQAAGLATAEHGLTKIEISLVLDVSGSMGGSKIIQLRDAAKGFVDLMLPAEGQDMVSLSVIPYNASVNLGDTVSQYFTLENVHTYSSCPTFAAADFTTTAIDPAVELTRLAHFDRQSSYTNGGTITRPWCATGQTSAVIAPNVLNFISSSQGVIDQNRFLFASRKGRCRSDARLTASIRR